MILDPEQAAAIDLLQSGANVFLTGSAGTGKSTVTVAFLGAAMAKVDVATTTGIAAINLRDQFASKTNGKILNIGTIYRWAGMGLGPKDGQTADEFYRWWASNMTRAATNAYNRIKRTECLIIDEVSMLPGKIISYLDYHFRMIRQINKPFGGMQVVFVGDFLQLPPVNKFGNRVYDWAFLTDSWHSADIKPAVMKTVHRQDEKVFVNLLNEFRLGRISAASLAAMKQCVRDFPPSNIPRLMTHNNSVDKWNHAQLEALPGETVTIHAILTGEKESERDWLTKNLVTPSILQLRIGARVMITANITEQDTGRLVACNGTLGYVRKIEAGALGGYIVMEADDGVNHVLDRRTWNFDQQDPASASFSQFPLRMAWASTIHKAQGLTLDKAWIDIRAAREPGQGYVAMSRVRTLAGLNLKAAPEGVVVSPAAVSFHEQLEALPSIATAAESPY